MFPIIGLMAPTIVPYAGPITASADADDGRRSLESDINPIPGNECCEDRRIGEVDYPENGLTSAGTLDDKTPPAPVQFRVRSGAVNLRLPGHPQPL